MRSVIFGLIMTIGSFYAANGQEVKNIVLSRLIDSIAKPKEMIDLKVARMQINKDSAKVLSETIARKNHTILKKIIKDYGYPGYSLVGRYSTFRFNTMVLDCKFDLRLQKKVLNLFTREGKKDTSLLDSREYLNDLAVLIDKVKINTNQKQIYGTQIEFGQDNLFHPKPTIDIRNLNKRRKQMRLRPIEDAIKDMNGMLLDLKLDSQGIGRKGG